MNKPTWPPIRCTRCGGNIYIELIDEGTSWNSHRVVDCISCQDCGAEWGPGGEPKETAWLADLEDKPT